MRQKIFIIQAIMLVFIVVGCNSSKVSWQSDVDNMINVSGEFSKARSILDSIKSQTITAEENRKVDSLLVIMDRIEKDFNITYDDGVAQLKAKIPALTLEQVNTWEKDKYLEVKIINGKKYFFRKAIRNLILLCPDLDSLNTVANTLNEDVRKMRIANSENIIKSTKNLGDLSEKSRVQIKFTLDVNANAVPAGDTIRVWAPYPLTTERQSNVTMISTLPHKYFESKNSEHKTIYLEAIAVKDSVTHFEVNFKYDVCATYYNYDMLKKSVKPYNKSSEIYKKYTANCAPHIIVSDRIKAIADSLTAKDSNVVDKAFSIFKWIDKTFPWAGAREYSTLANIPEYVLDIKHGDCGQVSLLLITMLRSQGIPAKWESGYDIMPNHDGMHDWAKIYYEGIGWVPVDMSFGLIKDAGKSEITNFYFSGIDQYRCACNENIGQTLEPGKKFIRCETVDFQAGEVETSKTNLYYDKWNSKFEIISITSIK